MDHQIPKGWHSRGYLPHFDGGEIAQFVTIRLYDSIPNSVYQQLESQIVLEDSDSKSRFIRLSRIMEYYADRGIGECWLSNDSIAAMVENSLFYYDCMSYRLLTWVIMPNHIHILITPLAGHSMSSIMKSLKTWTAKRANEILQRKGQFWMPDYYDRYIRDGRHFDNVIVYIENNPVKAGLCEKPCNWRFGSAWHRHHQDLQ